MSQATSTAGGGAADGPSYSDDVDPQLVENGRLSLALLLVATLFLFSVDVFFGDGIIERLWPVHATRFVVFGVSLLILSRRLTQSQLVALGVFNVSTVTLAAGAMAAITGELTTAALISVATIMGASALIPWGTRAQSVAVAVAAAGLLVAEGVWVSAGGEFLSPRAHIMLVIAMTVSVYFADQLDQARQALRAREASEREMVAELRRSNKQLEVAQRINRVGSWEWLAAEQSTRWSPEHFRIFGMDPETSEPASMEFLAGLRTEDRARILDLCQRAVTEDGTAEVDVAYRRGDEDRVLRIAAGRLFDDDGELVGIGGTSQDVTEQRRFENTLRESEARFRNMANTAPVLLWMTDRQGRLNFCNRAWLDFVGQTLESELAGAWYDPVHPDDRDAALGAFRDAHEAGREYDYEYRMRASDGEYRWLHARAVPRFADGDEIQGYIGSAVDVTQHRAAERTMREINEELERRVQARTAEYEAANRELESFAYSVSHDLRTPLRTLDGYSQILLDEHAAGLDDIGRNSLERIRAASQRMGRLIDDLLTLSRVSRSTVNRVAVDLSALARDVWEDVRGEYSGHSVDLRIRATPVASGDPNLLQLVLQNLLDNALKYTRGVDDAWVEFTTEPSEQGHAVYVVRDNGVGFSMEYQKKLFVPFERLHGPGEFEGTGIGLATVDRIVRLHGGRVWADGEVGKGATFRFSLEGGDASA